MRSLSSIGLCSVAAFVLVNPAVMAQQEWGTIKGKLVMENGKVPEPAALNVDKDKDHCLSKGKILSEKYVVNPKNKGVRNVVVWIAVDKDGHSDYKAALPIHPDLATIPADKKKVVMDQPCCKFEPHVVVLRKGQDFVGRNSGEVPHSMYITGANGVEINLSLPKGGELTLGAERWKPNSRPSEVKCTIHPWMKGYLFVFAHPYFAVTDDDGNFEIKNVPAGKLRLMMWQDEGWVVREKDEDKFKGSDGISITVPAGKTLDLGKVAVKGP